MGAEMSRYMNIYHELEGEPRHYPVQYPVAEDLQLHDVLEIRLLIKLYEWFNDDSSPHELPLQRYVQLQIDF